jgi:exodeoxyribonuclease-3
MHHAEGGHYTFWDYRVRDAVQNKLGWRVDHIWATPALAGRCTGSFIDVIPRLWERPSDHTFVVAEFDEAAG